MVHWIMNIMYFSQYYVMLLATSFVSITFKFISTRYSHVIVSIEFCIPSVDASGPLIELYGDIL